MLSRLASSEPLSKLMPELITALACAVSALSCCLLVFVCGSRGEPSLAPPCCALSFFARIFCSAG